MFVQMFWFIRVWFALLFVFIYLDSCFEILCINPIVSQEFILYYRNGMFQFGRAGNCVFKMAVTTTGGETDKELVNEIAVKHVKLSPQWTGGELVLFLVLGSLYCFYINLCSKLLTLFICTFLHIRSNKHLFGRQLRTFVHLLVTARVVITISRHFLSPIMCLSKMILKW